MNMPATLQVACPHCTALNRIPTDRLGQQPNCGRCHQPVFTGQPLELDQAGFARHVLQSELPVLIEEQNFEQGDALRAEIRSFLDCIRHGRPPVVSGEDGLRALETAIRITGLLQGKTP